MGDDAERDRLDRRMRALARAVPLVFAACFALGAVLAGRNGNWGIVAVMVVMTGLALLVRWLVGQDWIQEWG